MNIHNKNYPWIIFHRRDREEPPGQSESLATRSQCKQEAEHWDYGFNHNCQMSGLDVNPLREVHLNNQNNIQTA